MFMEPQSIVVDWALITSGRANVNRSRVPVLHRGQFDEKNITQVSGIIPGASVYSTGRTSGRQCGKVCMSLITMQSGPNTLIGQLWGRNKCYKNQTGPRKTFFTPMSDILDDIQTKFSRDIRPTLPTVEEETGDSCLTPRLVQSSTEEKTPMEYVPPTPEMALWTSHMTGGTFTFSGTSAPSPWPQISVPALVSDADLMASPYALRISPGDCVDDENDNHAMLKRGADTDPSLGDRDMEKRRRVG
ncbi:hypothetical protein B0O99DRAFT_634164 [Bisporella sp. PMI_857]|nr:hypothetical protein B0O99DRAFT_634164 [Bisporella sp. PMI_857]